MARSAGQLGVMSAVVYGTVAVACNFLNKSAMLLLPYAPNLVLLAQLLAMYATARALRASGLVPFPAFSVARCLQLLPLSLMYAAHASMVLRSLLYLNVAMYNTLKRMTPVLVLVLKAATERELPGLHESACVLVIVGGCVITGAGDLAFSVSGYSAALFCALLQAAMILLAEANDRAEKRRGASDSPLLPSQHLHSSPGRQPPPPPRTTLPSNVPDADAPPTFMESLDFHSRCSGGGGGGDFALRAPQFAAAAKPAADAAAATSVAPAPAAVGALPPLPAKASPVGGLSAAAEVLYYNAVVSLPLLTALCATTGELWLVPSAAKALAADLGGAAPAAAWAAAVAVGETALTGSLVWCTGCNSALTASIVGVLKGAVAVALGCVFLAGPTRMTASSALGVGVVLAGGAWYSVLKSMRAAR